MTTTADAFVCPSCTNQLQSLGRRPLGIQVIVYLHGAEQFRLLIEDGEELFIGRRESKGCIGLANRLPGTAAEAVSRRHLQLSFASGDLVVEDCCSRNGTVLRQAGNDERLFPGARHGVGLQTTVALPGGITIERSGRSAPVDGLRAPPAGDEFDTGRATRLLTSRGWQGT